MQIHIIFKGLKCDKYFRSLKAADRSVFLKDLIDGALLVLMGREFHSMHADTANVRPPSVLRLTFGQTGNLGYNTWLILNVFCCFSLNSPLNSIVVKNCFIVEQFFFTLINIKFVFKVKSENCSCIKRQAGMSTSSVEFHFRFYHVLTVVKGQFMIITLLNAMTTQNQIKQKFKIEPN